MIGGQLRGRRTVFGYTAGIDQIGTRIADRSQMRMFIDDQSECGRHAMVLLGVI